MKGSNSIEVNQATMVEIVQQWANVEFKGKPTVKSVDRVQSGSSYKSFKIELSSDDEDAIAYCAPGAAD